MRNLDNYIFAEEIEMPSDLLRHTLPYSTFYRDRYDFVFIMNILGVIEEVVEKTLLDYENAVKKGK